MPVQINAEAKKMTDCENNEIAFQLVRGDQTNVNDKYHTAFIAEVEPAGICCVQVCLRKRRHSGA